MKKFYLDSVKLEYDPQSLLLRQVPMCEQLSGDAPAAKTEALVDDMRTWKKCHACGADANTLQAWKWFDSVNISTMRRYCSKECWKRSTGHPDSTAKTEPASPPEVREDPYEKHRLWEASCINRYETPSNLAARARNVAALASELRRPVAPRFPPDGRSDRVYGGRRW